MKISVLLPRYAITGVPLAQARFARALAARGHQVQLIVGYVDGGNQLPDVEGVRLSNLGKPMVRGMLVPLMRHLLRDRPDVVFSAEDHLNTVTLLAAVLTRSRAKISGSSRVTPFDTYSDVPLTKRWALKQLTRLLMWRADALTCVSRDMVDQYRRTFRRPRHICVYNIVDDQLSRQRMKEEVTHPWVTDRSQPLLVAAGRLAPWKGFGDLLEAMKRVVERRDARLLILGDGPLRSDLQLRIGELGLGDNVQLLGYVQNPLKYFHHADVFVLSSLVEGLPNVLVEAMMCGCTPVATDCPTGPREVLQGGRYGYLAPVQNPQGLADAILEALDHPIPAALLMEAVRPFAEKDVIDRHFEVLGLCEKSST